MGKIQTYFEMKRARKWFRVPRQDLKAIYAFYKEKGLQCSAYIVAPYLDGYAIIAKVELGNELHVKHEYSTAGMLVHQYYENNFVGMLKEARAGCRKLGLKFTFKPAEVDCRNFWSAVEANI
jgi:hypothetical protein